MNISIDSTIHSTFRWTHITTLMSSNGFHFHMMVFRRREIGILLLLNQLIQSSKWMFEKLRIILIWIHYLKSTKIFEWTDMIFRHTKYLFNKRENYSKPQINRSSRWSEWQIEEDITMVWSEENITENIFKLFFIRMRRINFIEI